MGGQYNESSGRRVGECELDWYRSRQGPMVFFYEYGNEPAF
jgi:type VI protein secretion system component Hcp